MDEAQTNLEQALAFATEGDTILQTEYMDELLYDLGQIMEQKGDYAQAREYYGRVLNEFAGSNMFSACQERMDAIMSM